MAAVYPALKGKIGDTEYFNLVVPASWVANNLVIPSELEDWEDETVEERYQRKINYERVRTQIAPYLASDPHRFFGALIVTVINPEKLAWESVTTLTKDLPNVYRAQAEEIGFVTLSGQEVLVPLDGQHRLAAMKFAISGKDNEGNPIDGLAPNASVGRDLVTLLLIRHDRERARKIFNKVNRYARPTSKADNLITSDDDFLAVLAREIAADMFTTRLVNTTSNTISSSAGFVTTLATIYAILEEVLANDQVKRDALPTLAQQQFLRKQAKDFFAAFCDKVATIRRALKIPDSSGDADRAKMREEDLLMKPFVQLAAAAAAQMLTDRGGKSGPIKVAEALERLNKLDWKRSNDEWQGVLLNGEKVLSGTTARRFASRVLAYQIGARFQPAEMKELESDFKHSLPRGSTRGLPKPIK